MEKIAVTTRGKINDLFTFGTIVVVDKNNNIVYEKGDSQEIAYPRSSAKLMQAVTPLSLGAKSKYNLSGQEIAVMCASHSGEEIHIDTIRNMLEKIGLNELSLKCGPHYPFKEDISELMKRNKQDPKDIHNNCSGKHTGMLMSAVLNNWSIDKYYKVNHPVQKLITKNIEEICKCDIPTNNISLDGCGVPVHAMKIRDFAYGMARMSDYDNLYKFGEESKVIIDSITKYSEYTSGTDRIDHHIISRYPGKVIVKSGANGYFGGMILDKKLGFAIKTYDGISETRNLILIELLKKLDIIPESDYEYFDKLYSKDVKNHRKEIVGEIKVLL